MSERIAPSPTATRESIAWIASERAAYAHDIILTFAGKLSDPLAHDFLLVLNQLDTAYQHHANDQEGKAWAAITAHMPGFAPMLDLLRCHLQEDQPLCEREGRRPPNNHVCSYANDVRYEG